MANIGLKFGETANIWGQHLDSSNEHIHVFWGGRWWTRSLWSPIGSTYTFNGMKVVWMKPFAISMTPFMAQCFLPLGPRMPLSALGAELSSCHEVHLKNRPLVTFKFDRSMDRWTRNAISFQHDVQRSWALDMFIKMRWRIFAQNFNAGAWAQLLPSQPQDPTTLWRRCHTVVVDEKCNIFLAWCPTKLSFGYVYQDGVARICSNFQSWSLSSALATFATRSDLDVAPLFDHNMDDTSRSCQLVASSMFQQRFGYVHQEAVQPKHISCQVWHTIKIIT